MILIKLGGSIITNKAKALSARRTTINKIANELKKIKEPVIVVHGGGSYGHYWSVKYGMHTKPSNYNVQGVSIVKNSMVELNKLILDIFIKNKLKPYPFPPSGFMDGNKPMIKKIHEIQKISNAGFIPITYGDALWYDKRKSYILSGDRIMTVFAKALRPRISIFVLNVDGLFSDLKTKELIYKIKGSKPIFTKTKTDVTGGMKRKFEEASKISKMGLKVFFTNGNRPQRIIDSINGKNFEGTLFSG